MSTEITDQIVRIKLKIVELNEKFTNAKNRNDLLVLELSKLEEILESYKEKIADLESQVQHLNQDLIAKQQELNSKSSDVVFRRDEEIDTLVKEIELFIRSLEEKNV